MAISTPTLVAAGNGPDSNSNTFTTGSFAVTAGDIIIVMVGNTQNGATAYTITLNSNTHSGAWSWQAVANHRAPGGFSGASAMFVAQAPASSSGTVTFGFTGGIAGQVGYWRWGVIKCTGANPVPLQSVVTDQGAGTTLTMALAALASGSLVVACVCDPFANTMVANGGWTEIVRQASSGVAISGVHGTTSTPGWTALFNNGPGAAVAFELADAGGGGGGGGEPVRNALLHHPEILGQPMWMGHLGNHPVGNTGSNSIGLRFRAPISGTFDRIQVHYTGINNPTTDHSLYSGGHGGTVRISIQAADSANMPTGTNIAICPDWTVGLNLGALNTGQTIPNTWYKEHTFTTPVTLEAGKVYWIISQNVHADQVNNWLSVDTIGIQLPKPHAWLDPVHGPWIRQGAGAWSERVWTGPDETYIPGFLLRNTTTGDSIGCTYIESGTNNNFGGSGGTNKYCRQRVTPPATRTYKGIGCLMCRMLSGMTTVTLAVTDMANTVLASVNIDVSGLTVKTGTLAADYVAADFATPIQLTGGTQYALRAGSATADGGRMRNCEEGTNYFNGAGGCGGTTDYAEFSTNNGTSWSQWEATLGDIPFWLVPSEQRRAGGC